MDNGGGPPAAYVSAMDSNVVSALAGLIGAIIGGLTSVLTSWLVQRIQANGQWRRQEVLRREDLYNAFIETAVECYADALQHEEPEMSAMVGLYARIDQMRLHSTRTVIESAEEIRRKIIGTFGDPNRAFPDLRERLADGSLGLLGRFSEACRIELDELRAGRG